jgi:uncharacterized protein (DUF2267 family)
MEYLSFIRIVGELADIPFGEAERASCSTLHTLAQRLSLGETDDLARRLPEELRPCLTHEGERATFHLDEFLRRVGQELGVDRPTAEREALAVLAALYRAVGISEFTDARSELPEDMQRLLDDGAGMAPPPQPDEELSETGETSLDEFVQRVAERAGIDRERAQRASEAALEALALRITGGQVEDLVPLVPRELRRPLRRGVNRSGGRAMRLPLDDFLREASRLERVPRAEATRDTRAVLATLRDTIGEKEFHDITAQLPDEYRILLREVEQA